MQDRLSGAQVLIVEDDPSVSLLIQQALRDGGATVVGPAVDIEEALALTGSQSIDAAVISLIVEGVYCDAVAQDLLARRIPFAVTTGIGATTEHPELKAAVTVTKPFQASHLRGVLEALSLSAEVHSAHCARYLQAPPSALAVTSKCAVAHHRGCGQINPWTVPWVLPSWRVSKR